VGVHSIKCPSQVRHLPCERAFALHSPLRLRPPISSTICGAFHGRTTQLRHRLQQSRHQGYQKHPRHTWYVDRTTVSLMCLSEKMAFDQNRENHLTKITSITNAPSMNQPTHGRDLRRCSQQVTEKTVIKGDCRVRTPLRRTLYIVESPRCIHPIVASGGWNVIADRNGFCPFGSVVGNGQGQPTRPEIMNSCHAASGQTSSDAWSARLILYYVH